MNDGNTPPQTFEQSLADLEAIVEEMENGDLPLDEALAKFERGVTLSKQSHSALQAAEQKVRTLLADQNGEALQDFDSSAPTQ